MAPTIFPLRWESAGDQWWFASPIDCAAANGHYDLVRELLHMDSNLLIKLTSLPRIRRLESVWDDEEHSTVEVAKNRSQVAQKLLQECETQKGYNSLIGAGYGGWLMYTAAAAGDSKFVRELLERDPRLVFGEGEYGVTDIFYAAARGRNCEVSRMLLESSVSPEGDVQAVYRWEMVNRAVHAAARGGNVELLRELLGDGNVDVLAYRDAFGSTVLHSASGRGQVEVVKYLISSYDIIKTVDNQGNTALHVAAYRGHLQILKSLISGSSSSASLTNNNGDTFLHMAVAGSRAPSFRRLDHQIDLLRNIVSENLIKTEEIINVRNNEGRTALHMAVIDHNIQSDIVEMIMSARYVDLSITDDCGNTPLDLLKQQPLSPASQILIKRMKLAGGISNNGDRTVRNAPVLNIRMHRIGASPGTSFRIPDGEMFLHLGNEDTIRRSSYDVTSSDYGYSGEIETVRSTNKSKPLKKLVSKIFLRWPRMKEKKADVDSYSLDSYRMRLNSTNSPISLRQQHSSCSSMPSNKRILSVQGNLPTKKKLSGVALPHSVKQVLPKSNLGSPCSAFSELSPVSVDKRKGINFESYSAGPSSSSQSPNLEKVKLKRKHGSFNLRLMNNYLCFGSQRLGFEDGSISRQPEFGSRLDLVV